MHIEQNYRFGIFNVSIAFYRGGGGFQNGVHIHKPKAGFTQVKFFNGYPSNYICKFACVALLAHIIVVILKIPI